MRCPSPRVRYIDHAIARIARADISLSESPVSRCVAVVKQRAKGGTRLADDFRARLIGTGGSSDPCFVSFADRLARSV